MDSINYHDLFTKENKLVLAKLEEKINLIDSHNIYLELIFTLGVFVQSFQTYEKLLVILLTLEKSVKEIEDIDDKELLFDKFYERTISQGIDLNGKDFLNQTINKLYDKKIIKIHTKNILHKIRINRNEYIHSYFANNFLLIGNSTKMKNTLIDLIKLLLLFQQYSTSIYYKKLRVLKLLYPKTISHMERLTLKLDEFLNTYNKLIHESKVLSMEGNTEHTINKSVDNFDLTLNSFNDERL